MSTYGDDHKWGHCLYTNVDVYIRGRSFQMIISTNSRKIPNLSQYKYAKIVGKFDEVIRHKVISLNLTVELLYRV
jgi:hypothetical protein